MTRLGDIFEQVRQRTVADSREVVLVEYLGPFGSGHGFIRPQGCSVSHIAVATSYGTFRPGSIVQATQDQLGNYVLQAPPRGGAGAFPRQIESQVLEEPGAAAAAGFLVYRNAASGVFVSRHATDGSWTEDIGSPDYYGDSSDFYIAGPYPAAGAFSAGWFVIWDGAFAGADVRSVDPENGNDYTYSAPAGTYIGPGHLASGRLYWIEIDTNASPSACSKPNPCRLMSALPDLTDVTAESSTTLAGLDAADCWWPPAGNNHSQSGGRIRTKITVQQTPTGSYAYYVGFDDVAGSPSKVEALAASVDGHNHLGGTASDLDGTNSLQTEIGEPVVILDTSSIGNEYGIWIAAGSPDFVNVFVPPAQNAVYVLRDPNILEEYDTATSSPTLQDTTTIETHPSISSTILQVWRVGG